MNHYEREIIRHSADVRSIADEATDLIFKRANDLETDPYKRFQIIGRITMLVFQKFFRISIGAAEEALKCPNPATSESPASVSSQAQTNAPADSKDPPTKETE